MSRQLKYLEKVGNICPNCGDRDIKTVNRLTAFEPDVVCQEVECHACGSTWKDHYKLVGFSDLEGDGVNPEEKNGELFTVTLRWEFECGDSDNFSTCVEAKDKVEAIWAARHIYGTVSNLSGDDLHLLEVINVVKGKVEFV